MEIDLLIEKAGYTIKVITLLKKDFGVKGLVIKKRGGTFQIGIDSDHYMNEDMYYPFTLAEELGHILTHGYLYDEINKIEDAIYFLCTLSETEYRKMEQQARNVGSHILLPSFLFDPFVIDYCKQHESEIKKEYFYDRWDLSDYLSNRISKALNISKKPIFYTILKRYPEHLLIDRVIETLGTNIF